MAQQGQTREGWITLLEWMVEEQGMPVIEEPDYTTIIDYLSENYNTDRPNFPKPKEIMPKRRWQKDNAETVMAKR